MSGIDLTYTIINFTLGGTLFFLAVTALRDNFFSRLNVVSALLFLVAGLTPIFWSLSSVIQQYPSSSDPFDESRLYSLRYATELFFPMLIMFSLAITARLAFRPGRRFLKYLIFLPQSLHLVAALVFTNVDSLFNSLVIENPDGAIDALLQEGFGSLQMLILKIHVLMDKEDKFFPIINTLYGAGALFILYQGLRRASNQTYRKQSLIIFVGAAVPVLIYAAVFAVNGVFGLEYSDTILTPALTAGTLAFVMAFFWAVIRYQFLNVGLAVRQSIMYTISTGILVGVYLIMAAYAGDWIDEITGGQGIAIYIGVVVLALVFFQPLNHQIEELIRWMFLRSRSDFRNLIETFSRQTISVFEPAELRVIIEDNLKEHLMIEHVSFVLFDDRVGEYALLPGERFAHRHIIDRHDTFLGGIGQLDGPAAVDELSSFREGSRLGELLEARATELILPLSDADRLLGFIALPGKISGSSYTAEEVNLLKVLSNQLVAALTNARLYSETVEKKRLEEEVAMARQIQIGLLPRSLPSTDGYSLAAHSTPSRTVGGDFYDVIPLDNGKLAIIIADASGKGVPAAMVITQIQAMIRSELNNRNSIQSALENVNNYLVAVTSPEKYATLCFGIFDPKTRVFEYSNAGHNYPALVRCDGTHEHLMVGGIVIGAFPGTTYEAASVTLNSEDFIFFFTDGISETQNEHDEEYGEERLLEKLLDMRGQDAESIIKGALDDVDKFYRVDPPQDDRTIVVLKTLGTKDT